MPTPQQFGLEYPQGVADRLQLMLSYLLTTPRDVGAFGSSVGTALLAPQYTRPPSVGTGLVDRFLYDLQENTKRASSIPIIGPLARLGESIGQPARERLRPSALEEFLLSMAVPGGPRRPKGSTEKLLSEMERVLAPRNPRLPTYIMEHGEDVVEQAGMARGATFGPEQVQDWATNLQFLASGARSNVPVRDIIRDLSDRGMLQPVLDELARRGDEDTISWFTVHRHRNPRAMNQPEPPTGAIPRGTSR